MDDDGSQPAEAEEADCGPTLAFPRMNLNSSGVRVTNRMVDGLGGGIF